MPSFNDIKSAISDAIFGSTDVNMKAGRPEWEARIRGTIKFASPISRTEYEAKWVGGDRSVDKNLGIFTFPRINGQVVQDMGLTSWKYPLTIFFDGPKHDLLAKDFCKKCKESGRWKVWHPIHGLLYLQLVSLSEKDAPVDSGNITELATDWIEPINPETLMTGTEGDGDPDSLDDLAAEEFSVSVSTKPGALGRLKAAVAACQNAVNKVVGPIAEANALASSAMLAFSSTIDGLLTSLSVSVLSLAGSIKQTINLPGKIMDSKTALFNSFLNIAEEIFESDNTDTKVGYDGPGSFNVALVKSFYAATIMAAAVRVATSGRAVTRSPGAEASVAMARLMSYLIEKAEADQAIFARSRRLSEKYIALQRTYVQSRYLGIRALRKLVVQELSLPVAATFVTSVPSSPLSMAIAQYGASDNSFEQFVVQNDLKGIDVMLLEKDRLFKMSINA